MDVLSDMLGTIRLRSMIFVRSALTPPWGIRAESSRQIAFHIIAHGSAWLEIDDGGPIQVGAGNAVLLAPGHVHTLRDARGTPTRPIREMLAAGSFAPMSRAVDLAPEDTTTQLVCGCFHFEDQGSEALVSALPAMIHSGQLAGAVDPWLTQTIKLIASESMAARPGTDTIVSRLCDVLFVYLLRSHFAEPSRADPSWLRALGDPQIGASLGLIHESPTEAWTVSRLAARVGMSRSAFAARFAEVVGETPMRYLTRWRLQRAAGMLRAGGMGIAEIAEVVGYDSEASFSKAFKRSIGVAPGLYRREARAPVAAESAWSGA